MDDLDSLKSKTSGRHLTDEEIVELENLFERSHFDDFSTWKIKNGFIDLDGGIFNESD